MAAGYKGDAQNNITGSGSFDKIFLKGLSYITFSTLKLAASSPSFQISRLTFQNVGFSFLICKMCSLLTTPPPTLINCLVGILLLIGNLTLIPSLVLRHGCRNGRVFCSLQAELWGGQELGEKQHSAFMPLKRPKTKPDGQRNLQRSLRMIPLVRTFLVADSRSPSGRRSELGQVKKYPRRVMGTFQGLRKKHKEKSLSWEPTRSGQRQDFKTYKKDVFVCCAHARGTRSNSDSLSLHSRKVLLL